MEKTVNISALRVAAHLNLDEIQRTVDPNTPLHRSLGLFYAVGPDQYAHYFNYGVAVFINHEENEISAAIDKIKATMINTEPVLRENYCLKVPSNEASRSGGMKFESKQIVVERFDADAARTITSSLAQAIVLDYYHKLSNALLREVRTFTTNLEITGKLKISRNNMIKFIGRVLNMQSDIAGNSHIFSTVELLDDPGLEALHQGLQNHLDIPARALAITTTLRIIEDNVKVFLQLSNQRESNTLEWIIIALILVEIVNLFVTQWIN